MTEYKACLRMYNDELEKGEMSPDVAARYRALLDIAEAAPFWVRNRVWKRILVFADVMAATRGGVEDGMD